MNFLPFPDPVAAETVARTRALWEATKKAKRLRIGDSRTDRDVAAYRLPCGAVRSVHDRYRPQYPEGATPGLADVTMTLRFYPNDSEGYEYTCANFRPLT